MADEQEVEKFENALARAREALDIGPAEEAIKILLSGVCFCYDFRRTPERFELLRELYVRVEPLFRGDESPLTPLQRDLMAELYELWPKTSLEGAILKHDFPEAEVRIREQLLGTRDVDSETLARARQTIHELKVSGAESVHLAEYYSGLIQKRWGVLSRGRFWLTFWDLETGEIIRAEEQGLAMLASAIGRDGSHVLFSESWNNATTGDLSWSTSHRETYRKIGLLRGGTYQKSKYQNVRHYKVRGVVAGMTRAQEIEVERKEFEQNPIQGEILPGFDHEKRMSPRYIEWIKECFPAEQAEEIFAADKAAMERSERFVKIRKYPTLTITHDEIEGYLPAGTTSFVARSSEYDVGPKLDNLSRDDRIIATLAVEENESWIEEIIAPGYGLRGMYSQFSSPITEVCISSEGCLGFANGNGPSFGVWNLLTGDRLREFTGHEDRVTCLCPSIDSSVVASGSEDRTVRLWKTVTAECVRVFTGHERTISKVCVSLDASRILSADRGGKLKVWNTETGECLRTIQAHRDNISGLHLTFDRKFAASASWDKTVKVWNVVEGTCMKTFEFSDMVTSVTMTPDGRYLLASSYEGTRVWELIWRLEPREPVRWDEGARRALTILENANAGWEGKLGTPVNMTEQEIKDSLRRMGPGWGKGHSPHKQEEWLRVWHLDWNTTQTLGYAGYGWLTGVHEESQKKRDEWNREHPDAYKQ